MSIKSTVFGLSLLLGASAHAETQVAALDSGQASSPTQSYSATYGAYVRGFLVANLQVRFDVSQENYHLKADAKAAGIGRLFSSTRGRTTSYGRFDGEALVPQGVSIEWMQDDEVKGARIGYTDGAPSSFHSDYPLPPERIPKKPVDITTVGTGSNDPFLSMLEQLGAQGLDNVCTASKRMFDGRRLSLLVPEGSQLKSADEHQFNINSPVIECQSRWQPIAGYSDETLQEAKGYEMIDSHFARIGSTKFAAPIKITTKTRYGRFTVEAKSFFRITDIKNQ